MEHRRRVTLFDVLIVMAVVLVAVGLMYRIRVGLNYRWNWGVIPPYLFRYDALTGSWVANLLMQGFFTTIRLSLWSTLLATLLGSLMGLMRVSPRLFRRLVGGTYVELMRNVPPLVLVFIFYYFIGDRLMNALGVESLVRQAPDATQRLVALLFTPPSQINAFLASLITLALYEGAYITEIVRGGIQAVDKGQWEGAYALGLTRWQQLRYVILPPLAGQLVSTIKDSAIVSVISIQELTFQGLELMAATYLTFEIWITITALYLILTLGISLLVRRLELAMGRAGQA